MAAPCIIPVAAADALEWLAGRATDKDLILSAPLVPQAMFAVDLPDRRALFTAARRVIELYDAGCVTLVARATSERWLLQMEKAGCKRFHQQPNGNWRYWAEPAALKAWIQTMRPATYRYYEQAA